MLYSWSLPQSTQLLDFFRRYLMLSYRARLTSELRRYLSVTHGGSWPRPLLAQRVRLCSSEGQQIGEGDKSGRKRRRGGSGREKENGRKHEKEEKQKGTKSKHAPWTLRVKWSANPNPKLEGYVWDENRTFETPPDEEELSDINELVKDVEVGLDVVLKATQADWWNWAGGSTLIFWRWPAGFQRDCARDGMPAWIQASMPRFKRRAKTPKPEDATLLAPKFLKILKRGYVVLPSKDAPIKVLSTIFTYPRLKTSAPCTTVLAAA